MRLLRPKHWIKNGLIFVPVIFSGALFSSETILKLLGAFVVFSLIASSIYIINDIRDVEKDKRHKAKKMRPIPSGQVSIKEAYVLFFTVVGVAIFAGWYVVDLSLSAWLLLVGYFVINTAYSFGLKNIPIVDVSILSAGFVIRVLFGAAVVDVAVSSWLYMTILAGALYLGLGKRRNEIQRNGVLTRAVNKYYSIAFLDKNMYVCMALLLVFYSLWATDPQRGESYLFLTIPLLIVLFMTYSLTVEKNTSSGDPVDVLTSSKPLVALALLYVVTTVLLVYI